MNRASRTTVKGTFIAAAVFSLFAAGTACAAPQVAQPAEAMKGVVQCEGINACKGQGSCAGADNACKAQNSCKGQGWVEAASAKDCTDKGGKVVAAKM